MYVISSVGNRNAVSHVPKHVVWFNDWGWCNVQWAFLLFYYSPFVLETSLQSRLIPPLHTCLFNVTYIRQFIFTILKYYYIMFYINNAFL